MKKITFITGFLRYCGYRLFENTRNLFIFISSIPTYIKDFCKFQKNNNRQSNYLSYPILQDKTKNTLFETHYLYHPAWAARILSKTKPKKHIDISSTINFCSIISAFIPVEFYDYRPAKIKLSNLMTGSADLTKLNFKSNSIKSLSCMHTIEHIGLGRYGDKIDNNGDIKAINELKRVLAKDGDLLIVLPVGKSATCFNAHRIYSYEDVITYFNGLRLMEFSMIPDGHTQAIIYNCNPKVVSKQKFACGCFWFKK